MTIKQVTVLIENERGRLAETTRVLGESGIDIRALSIADTTRFGVLRLIVDNPERAMEVLKAAGFSASLAEVVAIGVSDQPGGLATALAILSDAGVSVEYMYAFVARIRDQANVILRVDDNTVATGVLAQAGFHLLSESDISG